MALNLVARAGKVNAVMLNAAAGACQKGMAWRRGISMLVEPDRISRILLATAFAEASEWESALLCHDPQDLVVCNACLNACGKASMWQQAIALLQAAHDHELLLDIVSYNSLLAACDWRQVRLLELAKESDVTTLSLLCSRSRPRHLPSLLAAVETLSASSYPVLKMGLSVRKGE